MGVQLVVVDSSFPDAKDVVATFGEGSVGLVLDPGVDGLQQIRDVAESVGPLSSLMVISDSAPGTIPLGNCVLDAEAVSARAEDLQAIVATLDPDGSVAIRGGDPAGEEAGAALVEARGTVLEGRTLVVEPNLLLVDPVRDVGIPMPYWRTAVVEPLDPPLLTSLEVISDVSWSGGEEPVVSTAHGGEDAGEPIFLSGEFAWAQLDSEPVVILGLESSDAPTDGETVQEDGDALIEGDAGAEGGDDEPPTGGIDPSWVRRDVVPGTDPLWPDGPPGIFVDENGNLYAYDTPPDGIPVPMPSGVPGGDVTEEPVIEDPPLPEVFVAFEQVDGEVPEGVDEIHVEDWASLDVMDVRSVGHVKGVGQHNAMYLRGAAEDTVLDLDGIQEIYGADDGMAGDDLVLLGMQAMTAFGLAGDDQIRTGDGDDTVDGGAGRDYLRGGRGHDHMRGGSAEDTLGGGDGDDTLDGGAGDDRMGGGAGDDVYVLRQAGDRVSERDAGGDDSVWSHLEHTRLPTHVENGRILTDAAADLVGNAASNLLYAGRGDNLLSGGRGSEVDTVSYRYGVAADATTGVVVSLRGGALQETGASGSDRLVRIENLAGSRLDDELSGNALDNVLEGAAGDDELAGGRGADTLVGGAGRDELRGGAGEDVFLFRSAAETGGAERGACDRIRGFTSGDDRIDLSAIDADHTTNGNGSFQGFVAAGAAFDAPGQLRFEDGVLYGNLDADADPEFAIALPGVVALDLSDLVA